jgi:hypothetical protein
MKNTQGLMKPIAFILLIMILILGSYLNHLDPDKSSQVMIEDSVGSTMAAPDK